MVRGPEQREHHHRAQPEKNSASSAAVVVGPRRGLGGSGPGGTIQSVARRRVLQSGPVGPTSTTTSTRARLHRVMVLTTETVWRWVGAGLARLAPTTPRRRRTDRTARSSSGCCPAGDHTAEPAHRCAHRAAAHNNGTASYYWIPSAGGTKEWWPCWLADGGRDAGIGNDAAAVERWSTTAMVVVVHCRDGCTHVGGGPRRGRHGRLAVGCVRL